MVKDVIEYMGGTVATARLLSVDPAAVSQWIAKGAIPPRRAIQIERVTEGRFKAVDITEGNDEQAS